MIHRHIHQPRPPRPLSPAMALHQEVMRQVGAIVLGEGDDGKPITVEHVLRFSFDHLLASADTDDAKRAQVEAFNISSQRLDKLIRGLEKTAPKTAALDLDEDSPLAQQLWVHARLLVSLQQGKFPDKDLAAMANLATQANAIGAIIKQVGVPVNRR